MPLHRVAVARGELAVRDHGDRPPLLLVHGFPLDGEIWQPQIEAFRGARRVLAPDLMGFGGSSAAGRASVEEHADDLAALLDRLVVRRAVVVGLSMGGYVALAFWRRHPDRCAGLVLASTRAGPDSEAGRAGRYQMVIAVTQRGVAAVSDAMAARLVGPDAPPALQAQLRAVMSRQPRDGVIAALKAMAARASSAPQLPGITVPALVITGAADALIDPAESRALAVAIPGARLVVVPGAGHLVNLEEPGAFNAAAGHLLEAVDHT
jgi:3-oxoadipate enol-lactonase